MWKVNRRHFIWSQECLPLLGGGSSLLYGLVGYECKVFSIGGPGGDVEGALSAVDFGDGDEVAGGEGHEADLDVGDAVVVVGTEVFWIRDENHLLAVGGEGGKPVVEVVVGHLLLAGAIGVHAPDLHPSGAGGVEVDVLAVGGKLGAILAGGIGGETGLGAAGGGDGVNIPVAA